MAGSSRRNVHFDQSHGITESLGLSLGPSPFQGKQRSVGFIWLEVQGDAAVSSPGGDPSPARSRKGKESVA